jgi:hypothetical protein
MEEICRKGEQKHSRAANAVSINVCSLKLTSAAEEKVKAGKEVPGQGGSGGPCRHRWAEAAGHEDLSPF